MQENGEDVWSGQLLDANGRRGSIDVRFVADKRVAAWKLRLVERDGQPIELDGEAPFEDQDPRKPVHLKSSEELPDRGRVEWQLDLEPADAGLYAAGALVGAYRVAGEGTDVPLPLTRGVVIVWQFK